jgi:dienelactone hydrolase
MRLFPLFLALILGVAGARAAETPPSGSDLRVERLADGTRYATIGGGQNGPAPTLFVFQGDIETAMREPLYTSVARLLAPSGWLGVILDAPAHGEDHQPDEPKELSAWSWRVDHGRDLAGGFVKKSRAVLDHLIAEKRTDPSRIAAAGTSRGGFLAFHFAAAEPRIRAVGGISPVTELRALREFNDSTQPRAADALALKTLVPRLVGRPVWISIGNHDTRVDTDAAIALSRALVVAAPADAAKIPVELIVNAVPGHRSTEQDHKLLAAWLLEQF